MATADLFPTVSFGARVWCSWWPRGGERDRKGVADFLTVLDASRSLLSIEDPLVLSEINLTQQLIAIYLPLGGGSESAAPP